MQISIIYENLFVQAKHPLCIMRSKTRSTNMHKKTKKWTFAPNTHWDLNKTRGVLFELYLQICHAQNSLRYTWINLWREIPFSFVCKCQTKFYATRSFSQIVWCSFFFIYILLLSWIHFFLHSATAYRPPTNFPVFIHFPFYWIAF